MDPHLFLLGMSHTTEGTSLSVGKGPWNWYVFHEMEDNAGVRGTVSPLVWGEGSMLSLPEQGHSGALSWDHPLPHTLWRLRPQGQCIKGQLRVRIGTRGSRETWRRSAIKAMPGRCSPTVSTLAGAGLRPGELASGEAEFLRSDHIALSASFFHPAPQCPMPTLSAEHRPRSPQACGQ